MCPAKEIKSDIFIYLGAGVQKNKTIQTNKQTNPNSRLGEWVSKIQGSLKTCSIKLDLRLAEAVT